MVRWWLALGGRQRRLALGALVVAAAPAALSAITRGTAALVYLLPALGWGFATAWGHPVALVGLAGVTSLAVRRASRAAPRWQVRWSGVLFALALTVTVAHVVGASVVTEGAFGC